MAEMAEVYVKNTLNQKNGIQYTVELPDGARTSNGTIDYGGEQKITLQGTGVRLVLEAPGAADKKGVPFKVDSEIDLELSYSISETKVTTLKTAIAPNVLTQEVPIEVNVTMGDDPPGSE